MFNLENAIAGISGEKDKLSSNTISNLGGFNLPNISGLSNNSLSPTSFVGSQPSFPTVSPSTGGLPPVGSLLSEIGGIGGIGGSFPEISSGTSSLGTSFLGTSSLGTSSLGTSSLGTSFGISSGIPMSPVAGNMGSFPSPNLMEISNPFETSKNSLLG